MASVKAKIRPSTNENKEGTIYYQIIQNRVVRQLKTGYHLYIYEWNKTTNSIVISNCNRKHYLLSIKEQIDWDIKRLQNIINQWEYKRVKYTTNDIINTFRQQEGEQSLFDFMQNVIAQLRHMGKQRTSETYLATLRSFMNFRENKDILFEEIDQDTMLLYEAYLHNKGLTRNTTSFYMRILRAVYNRAIERNITTNKKPFKHVYTGIDKTIKRAIPLKEIKQMKHLELSRQPSLEFARDMFLFSFYTRGMSFIDMAYLKKKDLSNGILSYRRRKTGQQLFIRWEKCMQEIVERWGKVDSRYMLSIIRWDIMDERRQYKNAQGAVNANLKKVGAMAGMKMPLTMYVARHSWASAAKSNNVPVAVISEALGHESESTTQIYLASLETAVVDKFNRRIIRSLG